MSGHVMHKVTSGVWRSIRIPVLNRRDVGAPQNGPAFLLCGDSK
jgi:hypothetical protein